MTDPARAAIEAQILAWMREPEWRRDDERFQRLALTLFEKHAHHGLLI